MLTDEIIEINYNNCKKMLCGYVKREGIENFIKWLDTTDIKTAPCSTKYHCNYDGGLIEHSLHVFERMFKLMKFDFGDELPYTKETIAFVSLLHDISKVNYYETYYKNVKNNDTGIWEQVKSYQIKNNFNKIVFGTHAENSVFILNKFFDVSYEESVAILNHMGGSNYEEKDVARNVIDTHRISKLAYYLHEADYYATCIVESECTEYDIESYFIIPESESTLESESKDENNETQNDEVKEN